MKKINIDNLIQYGKLIGIFGLICIFSIGILWKVYAEPKTQSQIDSTLVPVKIDIKEIQEKAQKQDKKIVHLSFESKQQLFLLKKIAGNKVVSEMEEVTLIFKPEDYEED